MADKLPFLNTDEYRIAPGHEGPHGFTWKDKPHRLIYDLCREVERLQALPLYSAMEYDPLKKGWGVYKRSKRSKVTSRFTMVTSYTSRSEAIEWALLLTAANPGNHYSVQGDYSEADLPNYFSP